MLERHEQKSIYDDARVVVTGGAGFIGSHLVDAVLKHQGVSGVTVIDDFVNGRRENLATAKQDSRLRIVDGDIRDSSMLSEVICSGDIVFHLACLGVRHSIHSPLDNHSVNAGGTLQLLQVARERRVSRFVHVSSSEVFGTARYVPMDEEHPTFPETVYGGAKLAGEAYARAYYRTYDMPVVVVRPFNTYGPRSHYEGDSGEIIPRSIVKALNGQAPVIFGDGLQTRDFMHVSDTVAGLVAIADCDPALGETINFGTGQEITMRRLCESIIQATGADLTPRFLQARPGDVGRLCVDSALIRKLIGFEPRTNFEEGITDLVQWFRQQALSPEEMLRAVEDTNWNATVVS
ncbi:NAD-dependent epimerase/dehydratase family protein [Paeniglutamicibacter gangotriensis]|uniref:NAD-dependent epimerase/dehydratase family protein n=2 Tax=Paeniglutamicibacter gangotriensis TaxID=254787 RepID=A0A5B0EK08_9MICC|nr:NAD-dependent epimerase/dehydratase family protein [Paeniglutamicibacter gangotriensis]